MPVYEYEVTSLYRRELDGPEAEAEETIRRDVAKGVLGEFIESRSVPRFLNASESNLYCYDCTAEVETPGDFICGDCVDDPRVFCPTPGCGTPLDGDDGNPLRDSQVSPAEWDRLPEDRCPDCQKRRQVAGWKKGE